MAKVLEQKSTIEEQPFQFNEFLASGKEDSISPFLTPSSRKFARHLSLKVSIISACLLAVAFIFSFIPHLQPLSYLFLVLVYFFAGIPALIHAVRDILSFEINIDVLMVLAAFLSILIDSSMEGALLLVLFALSGAMEDSVMNRARGALNRLHQLSPTTAWIVEPDDSLIQRSVKDISLGETVLVKSGEIVPLDGEVIKGATSLDLAHLTGEHVPIVKNVGDEVPSGAHNLEGVITLKVIRTSADSTVSRIIRLIREAQVSRPKLQRWFDKVSRFYAVTIICLAVFFAMTLPYFISIPFLGFEGSFYRALAFLIAASPCALIIAVPIAYLSAISACAKQGILLKGGVTLDALADSHTIAFDKTGTLTMGSLVLTEVIKLHDQTDMEVEQALAIAAALERNASHPIATAILNYTSENGIDYAQLEAFKALSGYGLEAITEIDGNKVEVAIGQIEFIKSKLTEEKAREFAKLTAPSLDNGYQISALLISNKILLFHFEDTVRPGLINMLKSLRKKSYHTCILSGDHYNSVEKVAKELEFEDFHADLKPEDKLRLVDQFSEQVGLAMVGDGVNDAPALARATVGISMGELGSTTAIDASDVILLQDNIGLLSWLLDKAKATQRIVKENVFLAGTIILFISVPALFGWIPLWLAVILHEGGTVLVGLNGLRLLKR